MAGGFTHKLKPQAPLFATVPFQTAEYALSDFGKGDRISGVTKGQFSLIDIIRVLLGKSGPAHVWFTSWTAGIRDARTAAWLLQNGSMLSLKILTDQTFPTRQPKYCLEILKMFGDRSIWCSNVHCKIALIHNDEFSFVVRSSMNLNKNQRFEQFDIDDCSSLLDWWRSHLDDIVGRLDPGFQFGSSKVERAFRASLKKVDEEKNKKTIDLGFGIQESDLDLGDPFDFVGGDR